MRVLITEDELHPHGGQERCLVEYAAGLAQRGHEIDLLYRAPGELLPEYQRLCRTVQKIPGHRLNSRRPIASAWHWLRSTSLAARRRHDVVYINQHQDSLFGAAVATLAGIPLVCHAHQPPPLSRGLQWQISRGKITRYIAVSAHTAAQYLARGVAPERLDVVYNGINLDRFGGLDRSAGMNLRETNGIAPGIFVVVYAGRLDREKGIEVLIDAFSRLGLEPAEGRLVVAGAPRNHPNEREATAYVRSLRARSDPRTCLWLDWRSDTVPLFQAADVVVLPSLTDEPFARVTLEALASGCPALVSDVGGSPEALTGELARFLIPPGRSDALAAALDALRTWREREPDLGRRCRDHVCHNFPLDRAVSGIETSLMRALSTDLDGQYPGHAS